MSSNGSAALIPAAPCEGARAHRLQFGSQIFEFLQSICNIKQRPFRNLDASKFEAGWKTNDDRTQEIADSAYFLGFDGLIAPGARWACLNLVLFT
jgi:hypothetical protein